MIIKKAYVVFYSMQISTRKEFIQENHLIAVILIDDVYDDVYDDDVILFPFQKESMMLQHTVDEVHIHLRFAAARDTEQQRRRTARLLVFPQ